MFLMANESISNCLKRTSNNGMRGLRSINTPNTRTSATANLCGAKLAQTVFAAVDLSATLGLDNIIHQGRSTIGIDTLYAFGGKISDVFLRGAGVPEDFISYIRLLLNNPIEFYSCFISYSHADKSFADKGLA
jgi:hypothetical protein